MCTLPSGDFSRSLFQACTTSWLARTSRFQTTAQTQPPKSWRKRLREELEAEITARQHRNAAEREFLTRKLAKADTERRKLLDAYYATAIDVAMLRRERERARPPSTAAWRTDKRSCNGSWHYRGALT
ncbi:MAG: hypothetical protein M0010_19600 [Actinomycetota bacterium]|nr:hypothetical protein [Actinomycetota bacterium]